MKKILTIASTFPSSTLPSHGVFVKERMRFVRQVSGFDIRVVSPVPYFPPIKLAKKWYAYSQIPKKEQIEGFSVVRPHYLMAPKIGGYTQAYSMRMSIDRALKKMTDFDFDLIDSHFVYPDGVAATKIAQKRKKPVVITCRGADILYYPRLPVIGGQIRWALQRADSIIALSEEIAEAAISNGAPHKRVTVIPNGVDTEKFQPTPIGKAREALGLPLDCPIVISVGNRQERKGFHILVDALPQLIQDFPKLKLIIVGGPTGSGIDYGKVIEEKMVAHGISEHVCLIGAKRHEELAQWYSSADLFALMTSREGSPNVVLEALACGVPTVATGVGGIPEILANSTLGTIVPQRTPAAAAKTIKAALLKSWDRPAIREVMEGQSWRATAQKVLTTFASIHTP